MSEFLTRKQAVERWPRILNEGYLASVPREELPCARIGKKLVYRADDIAAHIDRKIAQAANAYDWRAQAKREMAPPEKKKRGRPRKTEQRT